MKTDTEILNSLLRGEFISRFSLGDTWWIFIGEYYLEAHSIKFEEENIMSNIIKQNYPMSYYTIDQQDICKATILAANLRKQIVEIQLDEMKNITINFDKGSTMRIMTNTEIVDWQWSLSKSCNDPYIDYEIAI